MQRLRVVGRDPDPCILLEQTQHTVGIVEWSTLRTRGGGGGGPQVEREEGGGRRKEEQSEGKADTHLTNCTAAHTTAVSIGASRITWRTSGAGLPAGPPGDAMVVVGGYITRDRQGAKKEQVR